MEPLLTVSEVAAWFGVSEGWVYDHASGRKRPVLPARRLGGCLRFVRADCQRFLDDCAALQRVA